MVHAGPQVSFAGGPYTGSLDAWFQGTTLDDAAAVSSVSLITFTNARATVWPDPRFLAAPYLRGAVYRVWHGGELDDVLIDHPELDGEIELGNLLLMNGAELENQTVVTTP
jgi:hypothetical protein